jgi:hypothetical protein
MTEQKSDNLLVEDFSILKDIYSVPSRLEKLSDGFYDILRNNDNIHNLVLCVFKDANLTERCKCVHLVFIFVILVFPAGELLTYFYVEDDLLRFICFFFSF